MQISRHWRLNSQRYRLQGVHYENGAYSLQPRPTPPQIRAIQTEPYTTKQSQAELKAAS